MNEKDATPVELVRATARKGIAQARKTATDVMAVTADVITVTKEKGEAVIEDTREKSYRAAAETKREMLLVHALAGVVAHAVEQSPLRFQVGGLYVAAGDLECVAE